MHLRCVEIFCDVAQRRSFSKGAAAHQVSQSSASQAVLLLEKRLGTQLIDRSKRPLELTPAGQVYLDGCRELLERFRAIEDRVQQIQHRVSGLVRVAAIYSVGLMEMEACVKRFEGLYPEADLQVDYLHPDEVYQQVQNDEADLGLVSFPRHGGEIVSIDWQEQPMVVVVSPAHRLADRDTLRLADLDGEDFIGFTQELTIRREMDRWFKRARVSVNVVHEFDNIETIKPAVEIGTGIALLPAPTVDRELAAGTLRAIPLADVSLARPLGIVHRRHKQLTSAAVRFIEMLRQEARPPSDRQSTAPSRPLAARSEDGSGRNAGQASRRRAAAPAASAKKHKRI